MKREHSIQKSKYQMSTEQLPNLHLLLGVSRLLEFNMFKTKLTLWQQWAREPGHDQCKENERSVGMASLVHGNSPFCPMWSTPVLLKRCLCPPPIPWTEIKGVHHIPLLNPTHSTPDTRPLTGLPASVFAPYIHKASAIILVQPKSQHITLLLKIFPCSHLNMIKTSVVRVSDKALHICPQILTNQDSAVTYGTDGWKWHTHGNRWSWTWELREVRAGPVPHTI